ncbi:hypothetical protein [Anaeromyxobacter sp. SG26]|uniref:hypothetical protein n=1 Tax=Anaeromyxobacter sp. SG26 TaxID=2925407 RepID=UPI001F5AB99C|nr:hypothetical protein [Anaeromyxobacter sp. SG26]
MRVRCLIALGAVALPALVTAQDAPPPVRTLEERVSGLHGKLAPANARLRDLYERVGAELAAGTRAVLLHRDELGPAYALESASYALDGAAPDAPPPTATARGVAAEILDRRVAAGAHRVSAELVYRVRSSPDGTPRRLDVRSSYAFDARPGMVTRVTLVTYDRGGPEAEEERAAVRFELVVEGESAAEGAPAEGDPARR